MKNLNRNHHYGQDRFACLELKGRKGRMFKFTIARLLCQMGLVFQTEVQLGSIDFQRST